MTSSRFIKVDRIRIVNPVYKNVLFMADLRHFCVYGAHFFSTKSYVISTSKTSGIKRSQKR